MDALHDALDAAEERIGREINPTVYARHEWSGGVKTGQVFVTDVLRGKKTFEELLGKRAIKPVETSARECADPVGHDMTIPVAQTPMSHAWAPGGCMAGSAPGGCMAGSAPGGCMAGSAPGGCMAGSAPGGQRSAGATLTPCRRPHPCLSHRARPSAGSVAEGEDKEGPIHEGNTALPRSFSPAAGRLPAHVVSRIDRPGSGSRGLVFRQPRPGLPAAAAAEDRAGGRRPRHRRCASVCRWRYRWRYFQRYRWKSRQRLRPLSTMPPPAGRVR